MGTGILSPVHIALLLVVALMLFGAKRLPELGRSLGTGLRGFKESLDGMPQQERPQPATANQPASTLEDASARAEPDRTT
jgi:sec-independent protein translocase protein TatA